MSDREKRSQRLRFLFVAGAGSIALALHAGDATSQTSEVDSYDTAVTSQSKSEALKFIKTFASSHLVGDLIESLPLQVAQQVCAELKGGGPGKARKACNALQETLAAQPVVPAPEAVSTGGGVLVDPLSAGAAVSAGTLPDEKPASEQVVDDQISDDMDNADGTEAFDRPETNIPPAGGGTAGAAVVTGADTLAAASPDEEPARTQAAGDTDKADGTDLFNGPVAEIAPAAGGTAVGAMSCAVAVTPSRSSGDDTQVCGSNGKRDKSESTRSLPPVAATASVVSTTAPTSVSTSSSASTDIQPSAESDTNNSQSNNADSSNADSSDAQASNGTDNSGQTNSGQSSDQASNSQSGSAQSGEGKAKGDKAKGDKAKGDKAKGDKDKGSKGKGGSNKGSG